VATITVGQDLTIITTIEIMIIVMGQQVDQVIITAAIIPIVIIINKYQIEQITNQRLHLVLKAALVADQNNYIIYGKFNIAGV
jgi:hypothetical protein